MEAARLDKEAGEQGTVEFKHGRISTTAPNLLNRQFHGHAVNDVWVSDITYIDTGEGWLYLSVFLDLGSRKVVGWSMDSTMTAELVLNAFRMGISNTGVAPNMVHSDRGCQYASELFRSELQFRGCVQ